MAATETVRLPARRDTVAAKILRAVGKLPLQIFLAVVALLWLVPTIGLFITSILPASDVTISGWWKIFAHPSLATFSNYDSLFHNYDQEPLATRKRRLQVIRKTLRDMHPGLCALFDQAWNSSDLAECPEFAKWRECLCQVQPQAKTQVQVQKKS